MIQVAYTLQILWRRAPTWKKFSHPHLSVFHGVATKISPLALVYDWEVNGDIIHYVRSHPQPPRLALVRTAIAFMPDIIIHLTPLFVCSCCKSPVA